MEKTHEFKDIDLTFRRNPFSGDILVAKNVDAVKKSIRNLVMTNIYETPFDPEKGSSIRASLFENFTPMTTEFIKNKLIELFERYEPRVVIERVSVTQRDDAHSLEVVIYFKIRNLQLQDQITLFVERTR